MSLHHTLPLEPAAPTTLLPAHLTAKRQRCRSSLVTTRLLPLRRHEVLLWLLLRGRQGQQRVHDNVRVDAKLTLEPHAVSQAERRILLDASEALNIVSWVSSAPPPGAKRLSCSSSLRCPAR